MIFGSKQIQKIVKLLKRLKNLTFEKHLKRELAKINRQRLNTNSDEVNSIGVIYYLSDEETYKEVSNFVNELKETRKKVKVLGFIDEKYSPHYYSQKLTWDIITRKNLNWYYKPVSSFVKSFEEEEFDLLIDLTLQDFEPLKYASTLSKARFKVGRYSDTNASIFDLMIHTDQVQSVLEFIVHVKHYLSKINR
jgi:DNA-binding Lrp family transcriptional regulator